MQAEVLVEQGNDVGDCRVLMQGERLVIGRADDAGLRIRDDAASRRHAAVELTSDGLVVTDLGSNNGTRLDDQDLVPNQATPVSGSAELRIGKHVLLLQMIGEPEAAPDATGAGGPRVQDEYERIAELGRGGAGQVFSARHRETGQVVAIKMLLAEVQGSQGERFLREGAVRIDSPHVVQTYDVRVEDGRAWMIMELLEGRSAEDRLEEQGPLPIGEALRLCEETALGLATAHEQGLLHRDIKPANILITKDGVAKLGDFGIAKDLGAAQGLTITGQGMGTLAYVSPEQAEDAKRVEPQSDLYSLGATLYHLITGKPPFDPNDPNIIMAVFDQDPTPVQELRPDCPAEVAKLVHRLLEKDPFDRLPNAGTLVDKLRSLRSSHYPEP